MSQAEIEEDGRDLMSMQERVLSLLIENQQLRDTAKDVLDICEGWTRKMTDAEKIAAIRAITAQAETRSAPPAEVRLAT